MKRPLEFQSGINAWPHPLYGGVNGSDLLDADSDAVALIQSSGNPLDFASVAGEIDDCDILGWLEGVAKRSDDLDLLALR